MKIARNILTVGTWNVRTLHAAGKLELLKDEMKNYRWDILGLSEMRWTGAGEIGGGEVIWSGHETKHEAGVGFLLNHQAKRALLGYNPISSRLMAARFSATPFNITVIQAYAPTADSSEEDVEQFYEDLEKTLEEVPKRDIKVLMGDWNAKIGTDEKGWETVMGRYGHGDRNERGERLLEFAQQHDLYVSNTKFQQKNCRKWTWASPDGRTKNMVDLILIDKRWITAVQLCRTFQGADIDSDHSLVMANIRVKLKRKRMTPYEKRRDLNQLEIEGVRSEYVRCVEDMLGAEDDIEAEQLAELLCEAVKQTIPEEEVIKKKWITSETMKLVREKRGLKLNRNQSAQIEKQYKKKCNEVRKAARADKRKWLEDRCRDVEKYHGEHKTREVFKMLRNINKKWQPRQITIKDENNKVLTEKKEILERWTRYCSSLYKEQRDATTSREQIETLTKIKPPQEDEPDDDILLEEVLWAVHRLKKNKSPGVDKVTGEMLRSGGPQLMNRLHHICNKAWQTGEAPEIWKKSLLITIHKKGSSQDCNNYRTIALISHVGKILMAILTRRLQTQMEEHLADEQAGFRKDRSTVQQILSLRLIAEKAKRKGKKVYNCFVDFQKAFDSIDQEVTWAALSSYGVSERLITILKDINENAMAAVRIQNELGEWFRTDKGTRQGDPISPEVFISDLERAMDGVKDNCKGISVQGLNINNLRFADDIDIIEENIEELERTTMRLASDSRPYGLVVNKAKTKTMVFGSETIERQITLEGEVLENVREFVYLGSTFTHDLSCKREVILRFAKAKAALAALDKIWKSKEIALKTKLAVLDTCVFSGALYACETWVMTKEIESRTMAFERTCYRKVLRVGWRRKMTNVELYSIIGPRETLLQRVICRKLQLFGHICRMDDSRKLKTLMFGVMEGKNRRGRPCREWIDDVTAWCGKDSLQHLSHMARDRDTWREVVKSASSTYGR